MTATLNSQTTELGTTPQLKRIRATGSWRGALRTDLTVSKKTFTTAEPLALGGDDSAPTPMDYVVGAFLGCITVLIELVARERDVAIDAIELDATGSLDRRGFGGQPGVSPSFQEIAATVHLDADLTADSLPDFIAEVERRCPAYNLFNDAGVTPQVTWLLNGEVHQ